MKFIHIADVHLGMRPDSGYRWSDNRAREICNTFSKIIDVCNEDGIDMLFVAGDLFHKQPTVKALEEVDYLFSKLKKTKVMLMAGNHDFAPVGSVYQRYQWSRNVHMFEAGKTTKYSDEELGVDVYGFSYNEKNIFEARYDDLEPYDHDKINILMGHGGETNNVPIDFSKLRNSKFDYVALGHIHKMNIFSDKMAYSGSLEPLDRSEIGDHGYIYGEVDKEKCLIRHIPFATREYVNLRIEVESNYTNTELMDIVRSRIEDRGTSNIYTIILKGYRTVDLYYDLDILKDSYNIIEVIDETLPDYDFKRLYADNIDNIIGMYISRINDMDVQDELKNRALYLGIEALMK